MSDEKAESQGNVDIAEKAAAPPTVQEPPARPPEQSPAKPPAQPKGDK